MATKKKSAVRKRQTRSIKSIGLREGDETLRDIRYKWCEAHPGEDIRTIHARVCASGFWSPASSVSIGTVEVTGSESVLIIRAFQAVYCDHEQGPNLGITLDRVEAALLLPIRRRKEQASNPVNADCDPAYDAANGIRRLTQEEAAGIIREKAFQVVNDESPDFGRRLVHCFRGGMGCDWDEDQVILRISKATEIAIIPPRMGHTLAIATAEDGVAVFDIR